MVCVMDNFLAVERKVGYSTRMIVDRILEYYGYDLGAYPVAEDRWMTAFNAIFLSIYPILPLIFALVPWIYFYLRREKHLKNRQQFTRKIIIISIIGLLLGLAAPYIILIIAASLAAYGGIL